MMAIHVNILWEMGAAETILGRTLEKANGIIDGVTCGAGMHHTSYQNPISILWCLLLSNCVFSKSF